MEMIDHLERLSDSVENKRYDFLGPEKRVYTLPDLGLPKALVKEESIAWRYDQLYLIGRRRNYFDARTEIHMD